MIKLENMNVYQIKNYLMWYDFLSIVREEINGNISNKYRIRQLNNNNIIIDFADDNFKPITSEKGVHYDEYGCFLPRQIYTKNKENELDAYIGSFVFNLFKGRETHQKFVDFLTNQKPRVKTRILNDIDFILSKIPLDKLCGLYIQKATYEKERLLQIDYQKQKKKLNIKKQANSIDITSLYDSLKEITNINNYNELKQVLIEAIENYDKEYQQQEFIKFSKTLKRK